MKVIQINESYHSKWNDYIVSHPHATFYHRLEWKDVIEKSFGHKTHYLIAIDEGDIVGILPIVHLKSLMFGSIFSSMPYLNFGGICANNVEAEESLLAYAEKIVKRDNGYYLELRHLHKANIDLPSKTHKVSMTLNLDPDPDVLWNNFKSKHRTNIRRSYKNELKIQRGGAELLDTFYEILSVGWRDLGTPIYRKSFFRNIINSFGDSVEIFLVFNRNQAIATAFNGLFKDTVEGMWTYSLKEHAKLQTNYYLYWEMIKTACEENYNLFHLGRSTSESGAIFFKKKWNAELKQLYWQYILNREKELPELNVDNPKYKRAIDLWKRLPVGLTRAIGPFIAKNIP